jgi:hypothetical protein
MVQAARIPQTMEEAVAALLAHLDPAARQSLRAIPCSDLSERTWWLAGWIRNEFGIWDGRSPLLRQRLYVTGNNDKDAAAGFDRPHPDDVSVAIIRKAWELLQQDPAEPAAAAHRPRD